LNSLPEKEIRTRRCVLTALRAEDRIHIVRLFTDADVRQFLGGPVSTQRANQRCDSWLAGDESACRRQWAVRKKDDGVFIGVVILEPYHDPADTELSYLFLPEWWGSGYATEAAKAAMDFARDNMRLPRIVAETQTANAASCRLLEKIGMKLEKTLERFGAPQSVYVTGSTDT
jgi:[ribosomal protein S5]-alanine N-acetyltransferase